MFNSSGTNRNNTYTKDFLDNDVADVFADETDGTK